MLAHNVGWKPRPWSLYEDMEAGDRQLPRALVIGSGVPGLVTIRIPRDSGFPVVVLDGTGPLGGRIWTDRTLSMAAD